MIHDLDYETVLKDMEHGSSVDIGIRQCMKHQIEVYVDGYGECCMEDGFGAPIVIEFYEGRLRVITFPDINSEDVTVIDMEGARETTRKASA